ncbi:MAG: B12-binding domain-containing radical SAM protein [Candidatus Hodarchaeota archaeon]
MKVLLINPPSTHTEGSSKPTIYTPVGILSIAAMLEKADHEVVVYDTKASYNVETRGQFVYLGDSDATIKNRIKNVKPDVIGISNPFTVFIQNTLNVAKTCKEIDKKTPVIVGGPHASIRPEDFLKDDTIDFVVMGEGEYTILDIFSHLEGKMDKKAIKGIAYKDGGKIQVNERREFIEDLDDLPLPAYHLVDMEKYFKGLFSPRSEYTRRAISMITSRGCPYNCIFCSIALHMGKKWRGNSPEYVIKHIKHLIDTYKIKLIHFEDDNFTLKKDRFEKILDGIIENKIKIKWDTPNGVRADTFNKRNLIKARLSGCQYLILAVESGNQRILDEVVGKKLKLDKVEEVAKLAKEIGIDLEAFYVVGMPGETVENMRETFEYAVKLNKQYDIFPMFNIASPLIGTRLFKLCEEKGYFSRDVSADSLLLAYKGSGGMIKTDEFTPGQIDGLFKEYGSFIRMTRIKKVLKHPFLVISYVIKLLSRTKLYNLVKKLL